MGDAADYVPVTRNQVIDWSREAQNFIGPAMMEAMYGVKGATEVTDIPMEAMEVTDDMVGRIIGTFTTLQTLACQMMPQMEKFIGQQGIQRLIDFANEAGAAAGADDAEKGKAVAELLSKKPEDGEYDA